MIENTILDEDVCSQSFDLDRTIDEFFKELESFSSQFDYLGSVRYEEYREYDSIEFEYYIKNINGMSPIELIPTIKAIEDHMKEFSISKGIYRFYLSSRILFER